MKDIKSYIADRSTITPENINEIQIWLHNYGGKFKKRKPTMHVGNKISLYAKAIDLARTQEEKIRIANQALGFLDGVFIRNDQVGTVVNFRAFEAGHFLDDGTLLEECPECGQVGIVLKDVDILSKTIHKAQINLIGYESLEDCPLFND